MTRKSFVGLGSSRVCPTFKGVGYSGRNEDFDIFMRICEMAKPVLGLIYRPGHREFSNCVVLFSVI